MPYFQSSGGIALWHTGFADSLAAGGLSKPVQNVGLPGGAPVVFGASLVYLQAILIQALGILGIHAYAIVGCVVAIVAGLGAYLLARKLQAGPALALLLAFGFLSQTFFSVHILGYGAMGYGVALLPAFCLLIIWMMDQCCCAPRNCPVHF